MFKPVVVSPAQLSDLEDSSYPNEPQPHWFHTLQVRRLRVQRSRSNSDPLGGQSFEQEFQWVSTRGRHSLVLSTCRKHTNALLIKPLHCFDCPFAGEAVPHDAQTVPLRQKTGLQFGTATSYLNLEKLGEGAYATVYKGISR